MYTPGANLETDVPTLREFVRNNPLCALVSTTNDGLVASHIPVVLHEREDGFGVLQRMAYNARWLAFVGETPSSVRWPPERDSLSLPWRGDSSSPFPHRMLAIHRPPAGS